jgi:hypothetical protein
MRILQVAHVTYEVGDLGNQCQVKATPGQAQNTESDTELFQLVDTASFSQELNTFRALHTYFNTL